MAGYNSYLGGINFNPYGNSFLPNNYYMPPMQSQVQQPQNGSNGLIYVHGIEGANAYQLQPGVNQVILWDDTLNSFYIKGYDNMGKPKVLAWNDFHAHVEEPPAKQVQESKIDLTNYPTKEYLDNALKAFDLSKYVTKEDLETVISKLAVGEHGKVVVSREHNA